MTLGLRDGSGRASLPWGPLIEIPAQPLTNANKQGQSMVFNAALGSAQFVSQLATISETND